MKKLVCIAICLGLMAFGSAGSAGAYSQTVFLGQNLEAGQTANWHFDTPKDFEVPYDQVISAFLGISAITAGGDAVTVEGKLVGDLDASHPSWKFDTTTFDIKNIYAILS